MKKLRKDFRFVPKESNMVEEAFVEAYTINPIPNCNIIKKHFLNNKLV